MKIYFKIPLAERLAAFKRNEPRKLGGHWTDENQKWHYVPDNTIQDSRFGAAFKIGSFNCRWCEDVSGHFRETDFADKIVRLNHRGWFVDNFQSETTRGQVLQLPARHGQTLFMAACTDPCNPNCAVVEIYLYDNKEDAARAADLLAERYAEDSREGDLKQMAKDNIAELKSAIINTRKQIKELLAGIRQSNVADVVCKQLRADVRRLRAEVQQNLERIQNIESNPYILIEP